MDSSKSIPLTKKGLVLLITAVLSLGPISPSLHGAQALQPSSGASTGPGGAATAAGWAAEINGFFRSRNPDPASLNGALLGLNRLDLHDPAVRANVAPVTRRIQAAAQRLLNPDSTDKFSREPRTKAEKDALFAEAKKMRVLVSAFSSHLTAGQQAEAQYLASVYDIGLLSKAKSAQLLKELKGIAAALADPAAKSLSDSERLTLVGNALGRPTVPPGWGLQSAQPRHAPDADVVFEDHEAVTIRHARATTSYAKTDRPFGEIFAEMIADGDTLPGLAISSFREMIAFLKNKKVLDIGCGPHGRAVQDLRKRHVDAVGIDISLDRSVRKKRYLVAADALRTGLPDNDFDVAYSAYSVFLYEANPVLIKKMLKEAARLVKHNGLIILTSIPYEGEESLRRIASRVPGLKPLSTEAPTFLFRVDKPQ